jgi:uncharacterized membrane protein
VVANLGIIPAGSTDQAPVPVYDAIFEYVAPLAICGLILGVNLRHVLRAGVPLLLLFLIGALGTVAGVLFGMRLVGGPAAFGDAWRALGGMFTGTYIGGSINFNAVALEYDVVRDGVVYAGSVVVDNIITTAWMVATLALPRLLAPLYRPGPSALVPRAAVITRVEDDTEALHPWDVGLVVALGLGVVAGSRWLAEWLGGQGIGIPFMLVLTAAALVLAQVPAVARLRGVRVLGMFAVYLFLNVIGAFCDVRALAGLGRLGLLLLALAGVTLLIHGLITFVAARLMRLDADLVVPRRPHRVGGQRHRELPRVLGGRLAALSPDPSCAGYGAGRTGT